MRSVGKSWMRYSTISSVATSRATNKLQICGQATVDGRVHVNFGDPDIFSVSKSNLKQSEEKAKMQLKLTDTKAI